MMNKNVEIQKKIREERIKQGISIRKLAKMAGCTERAIAYWEKGEKEITVNMADRMLKTLGVKMELGAEGRITTYDGQMIRVPLPGAEPFVSLNWNKGKRAEYDNQSKA